MNNQEFINTLPSNFKLLGVENEFEFKKIDLSVTSSLAQSVDDWEMKINKIITKNPYEIFHGGYLEERFFYTNDLLFKGRDIHLGVDLWTVEHTKIYVPFDGVIYSCHNNDKHLDYGNTLILKHHFKGKEFFSLYGHLSSKHVNKLKEGAVLKAGEYFCEVGNYEENGHWPPHLHFQLIMDMGGSKEDYKGVCAKEDILFYKNNCPDGSIFIFNQPFNPI